MPLDLYYCITSPFSRSVLLTSRDLGVELNLKEVDIWQGEQFKAEYLALNPEHTVPTLVDGDLVLWERQAVSINAAEDVSTIKPMAEELNKLIDKEVSLGIDIKRIVVGGFSMGSSMALQMGYCFRSDVGGIVALSSFLNERSNVYKVLESVPEVERPPLFMCHGDSDKVVPCAWGERTFAQLQQRGVKGDFHSFPGLNHSLCKREVELMKKWLVDLLPDV